MSGHSKWSSIKHKKAATDAKRGKIFSKLAKEITVLAKAGGGDLSMNASLRMVVDKAKSQNMPADNIDRAIKKGTGELPGVTYEEITYEGYGANGVAIVIEALTDNKNRTISEVRNIFSKRNGNMAGAGSVLWLFKKKGFILVNRDKASEDDIMHAALEAGAEDLKATDDVYEIITEVSDFENVKSAIGTANIEVESAELTMIPSSTVQLDKDSAKKVLGLIDALEDHDDVQNVYANFDIPDDILKESE